MISESLGDRILDLIRKGGSCRAVAREAGVAPSTVSRRARAAGLTFDRREQTEHAAAAVRVDAASRRAEVGAALLEDIDVARRGRLSVKDAREFANVAQGVAALARAYKDLAVLPGSPDGDSGAEEVKVALIQFLSLAVAVNEERHPPADEVEVW